MAKPFQKTILKFQRLDELKREISNIELRYRMMGQTTFGKFKNDSLQAHAILSREFNDTRYWWMKSIKSLKS